jgi:DNA (cytosine-5)-methyltransferase 1
MPGKPDFTLHQSRIALFVDGDFWHGLQWAARGHASIESQFRDSKSARYWVEKIRRNMERDCEVTNELVKNGWRVVRLWESDVHNHPEECIRKIMHAANRPNAYDEFAHIAEKSCAEFFAGIGLMRLGLEKAGWSIRFANDIDEQKFEIYRANFDCADGHFIREDIHKLKVEQIPTVALATASFPCNDLSLAGARQGLNGLQSSAFWGFVDALEGLGQRRPPIILLENVTGFLSSHGGRDFAEAMLALNRLNYTVDPFIMDAAWFVPQSRQRLFIVGISKAFQPTRSAETQRFYESHVRPKGLADFILQHSEIDWRIRKLPVPPRTSATISDIIEDLPPDSAIWWSIPRAKYLLEQMSAKHREAAARLIAGRNWSYGTVFRRVRNG